MIVISDQLVYNGGPLDGVPIAAWNESRFAAPPGPGAQPPAGNPDAGPVISGSASPAGGRGSWQLVLPTTDNYWLSFQIAGAFSWQFRPGPVVQDQITTGDVQFGSGAVPAAGIQATVLFAKPRPTVPAVLPVPGNPKTWQLGIYPTSISRTGFAVASVLPPAANQPPTTYDVHFIVIG